jgi:hypothetical protein
MLITPFVRSLSRLAFFLRYVYINTADVSSLLRSALRCLLLADDEFGIYAGTETFSPEATIQLSRAFIFHQQHFFCDILNNDNLKFKI